MADNTHIEWTDATWNVVTGCSVVSPGCTNCYAMRLAGGRMQHHPSRAGLTIDTKAGPVWNGQVRFNEAWLTQPRGWKSPRRIFVAAHGDLFHEGVALNQLDQIFAIMALCPQHTFQILTKRPHEMQGYISGWGDNEHGPAWRTRARIQKAMAVIAPDTFLNEWPLPNVWLGVSVEDQARANERIPALLATPAAVRWISAEPLLGSIDLSNAWLGEDSLSSECWGDCAWCKDDHPPLHNCQLGRQSSEAFDKGRSGLDWVVVGGESGPSARPMHIDWVREIRDQCDDADVPFLFKQRGAWSWVTVEGDRDWDTIDEGECEPMTGTLRDSCLLHRDGRMEDDGGFAWPAQEPRQMLLIGKKAAGRTLDGVEHNGYPA